MGVSKSADDLRASWISHQDTKMPATLPSTDGSGLSAVQLAGKAAEDAISAQSGTAAAPAQDASTRAMAAVMD